MDRNVWRIYTTGNPLNDYRRMFQTADLSSNPEVLWFKMYDGDKIGNNVNRYLNQGGGGVGVTASLVDDYLTRDGKPFTGEARIEAKKVFGDELQPTLRDPRLVQTVCAPRTAIASGRHGTLLRGSAAHRFFFLQPEHDGLFIVETCAD